MDQNNQTKVVTRFAPSPTGNLHVGAARTALYAFLHARKNDGTFILRIEDTDKNREVDGAISHIQESLTWLGIGWDYGPDKENPFGSALQSKRLDIYRRYAIRLLEKGLAYPDPYTAEEVEIFREEAKKKGQPFLFRNHRPETVIDWDGTKPLRFRVPEIKRYTWQDAVRGELSAGPEMLDDFILIKADGYPTYNFAHIIDDLEMNVTHIFRADEFIASTPKFLSLYDALEIPYPVFVTLPPIMGADGKKKLSKRDGAKDILDYRTDGILPEALCNFLALIGWNPGGEREIFTPKELIELFTISKVQRSGGAFNEEKLLWMNKEHLRAKDHKSLVTYLSSAIPTEILQKPQYSSDRLERMTNTVLERLTTKKAIAEAFTGGEYNWAFTAPEYNKELLQWKNDTSAQKALPRLKKLLALLEKADFTSADSIKAHIWPLAEDLGKGELLWPTRVALSGKSQSPDPFTLSYILGPVETISRIKTACDKINE